MDWFQTYSWWRRRWRKQRRLGKKYFFTKWMRTFWLIKWKPNPTLLIMFYRVSQIQSEWNYPLIGNQFKPAMQSWDHIMHRMTIRWYIWFILIWKIYVLWLEKWNDHPSDPFCAKRNILVSFVTQPCDLRNTIKQNMKLIW